MYDHVLFFDTYYRIYNLSCITMYNHSFWRVMSHEQRLFNRGFHRWIHVIRAESLPEDAFLVEVELLANEGRGCVLAPWPSMAEDLAEPP